MWDQVEELNAARAALNEEPWLYTGDVNLRHGGMAVCVDRRFGYANVVEFTDLDSATGVAGAMLVEVGSVSIIDRPDLRDRRRIRDALECSGDTMAKLAADYQGDRKWMRWARIAESCYRYGFRDTDSTTVLVYDREEFEESRDSVHWPDNEDCPDLVEAFMEMLS